MEAIMIDQLLVVIVGCLVAMACALPGVFLVLRQVALMSDAISHAILLGIVVAFFVVKDLHSPLLILGAALTGILTVALTELVIQSGRLKKDAAIGLIFPFFFSIGVILIAQYAGNIHLDTDAVLLGEIAFSPFNQLTLMGRQMGPIAIWVMGGILLLNIGFITTFYKELKVSTFDPALAASMGFSPVLLHYALMTLVSITAVGAFDAVGSILVVALMITPPATAYLLTRRLKWMLGLSMGFGVLSALIGFALAVALDASIAGAMASVSGVIFLLAFFLSPEQGLIQKYLRHKAQKVSFASKMLMVHLLDHENTPIEAEENTVSNMIHHMGWSVPFVRHVTRYSLSHKYINRVGNELRLTNLGRELAKSSLTLT
jgi:manganese/zinc/iron transport system permease protein